MTKIRDLAICGGRPAFSEILHVGRPNIGDKKKLFLRINDILDRNWLTNNGPLVQELEKRISDFLGVKHCIAMSNGTIALEIAIRALGFSGEVILPSFTFVATAHALQWQEITPVFCDIDPGTYNIDVEKIESLVTSRTTGIIGTHLWGRPCDIEGLKRLAAKKGLRLLFDAAHAFATSYKGQMIGNFGHAEVFSFHATKIFNTFEGGAIVTNDDRLAKKIRLMKNFGFAGMDNVIYLGINGKMNEVSAAMGLSSLENLDDFIKTNKENYEIYYGYLGNINGIRMLKYNEKEKNNFQYIVIEIDENKIKVNRDKLMKILHAENIRVRRYFYPGCHKMEPYRTCYPNAGLLLPETERISHRVLCFPTGTAIKKEDVKKICQLLLFIIERYEEIINLSICS